MSNQQTIYSWCRYFGVQTSKSKVKQIIREEAFHVLSKVKGYPLFHPSFSWIMSRIGTASGVGSKGCDEGSYPIFKFIVDHTNGEISSFSIIKELVVAIHHGFLVHTTRSIHEECYEWDIV